MQAVFLHAGAAQGAFTREAGLLRDPQRGKIVGVDVQPHALQAASGQRPPGEASQRLGGKAPAASARADAVADLGATRVPVDVGEEYPAGDPVIVRASIMRFSPVRSRRGSCTASASHQSTSAGYSLVSTSAVDNGSHSPLCKTSRTSPASPGPNSRISSRSALILTAGKSGS